MRKKPIKSEPEKEQLLPEAIEAKKNELPTKKTLDPLYPLNQMECPWCHASFAGYEKNKNEECQECGKGYIVIKVKREFFVLT